MTKRQSSIAFGVHWLDIINTVQPSHLHGQPIFPHGCIIEDNALNCHRCVQIYDACMGSDYLLLAILVPDMGKFAPYCTKL